jgi:predicted HTH domain antitoxin
VKYFGRRAELLSAAANGIAAPGYGCYSAGVSLKLDFADDVAHALRLPPAEAESEMLKELALALYARGALGFGKARALAGLSTWDFDQLLGERRVNRPYSQDDLEMDLKYARGNQ